MDGVLTDSEPLINASAIKMFREQGIEARPEDFLPFVGTGEDRYIDGVAANYHLAVDLAMAKHRTYEIYLELVPQELRDYDAVVFDPPRQGAQAQATQLAASKVPTVVAVSCNVTTFARDAKILIDGGYTAV